MNDTMKQWALYYASMGFRVFPVVRGTKGSTINGKSGQLLRSWKDEATSNPETIDQWWGTWPDADICIATGNGLLVIDLDVKGENGLDSMFDWVSRNGCLPATAVVQTKSGGQHQYYFVTGTYPNSRGFLPGVDIRSDGGYVVAPPSDGYLWVNQNPIAQADQTVYDFLEKKTTDLGFSLPATIAEGGRNDTLFRYAASLQAKGVSDSVIRDELLRSNEERCQPPLEDKDIEVILDSVLRRYKKGNATMPNFPDVKTKVNKDGTITNKVLVTANNTAAMLDFEGYAVYYDVIRRETVIKRKGETVVGIPQINYESMLTHICDQYTRLGDWTNSSRIHEHMKQIAAAHQFNAARYYLEGNYVIWGGSKGIDELINALTFEDNNELYSTLIRKWLCQCVAMVHNDRGSYGADGVLVLKGPQGIGKTTFFRKCCELLGVWYFVEGAFFDGTKDRVMINTKAWITELGELPRSLKDTDTMKAFVTSASDRFRMPYDKDARDYPRYTSFGATTNDDRFLKDDANRRYWVVPVKDIDLGALNRVNFSKVWAEAYELFRKHGAESFRLTGEERALMEKNNDDFRLESEEERLILESFNWQQPKEQWKEYTATQVAGILGRNVSARKVGRVLSRMETPEGSPIEKRVLKGILRYTMPSDTSVIFF